MILNGSAPQRQGYTGGAPAAAAAPSGHAGLHAGGDDEAFDASPYDYTPHQPYQQQPATRAPPPSGPPPAYYRVLNRTYPHTLRPVLLLACFVSMLYLILLGVGDFRTSGQSGVTGKYKTFTLVQGILFVIAAGIELLGIVSTYSQRLSWARMYALLSLVAFGAIVASQVIGIVVLFVYKNDVIAGCATYYQGSNVDNDGNFWNDNANNVPMSAADATAYCQTLWGRSRTWDIVWLFVTTFVGALFVLFGFAYARQLSDPSSVRSKVPASAQYAGGGHGHQNAAGGWNTGGAVPMGGAYDPNAPYSYPPPPHGNAYPPPPGPPPPEYKGRPSMDDVDFDAKTPTGYEAEQGGYEYERHVPASNRPGSSRSVRREVANDEDDDDDDGGFGHTASGRRDSGDTLRGEIPDKDGMSVRQHDDHTPRI